MERPKLKRSPKKRSRSRSPKKSKSRSRSRSPKRLKRSPRRDILRILKVVGNNERNTIAQQWGAQQLLSQLQEDQVKNKPYYKDIIKYFTDYFTTGDKPIENKLEKLDTFLTYILKTNYPDLNSTLNNYEIHKILFERNKDFSKSIKCEKGYPISVEMIIDDQKIDKTFQDIVINNNLIDALNYIAPLISVKKFYTLVKLIFLYMMFTDFNCQKRNGDFAATTFGIKEENCSNGKEDAVSMIPAGGAFKNFKNIVTGQDPASRMLRAVYEELPDIVCIKDPITWEQSMIRIK